MIAASNPLEPGFANPVQDTQGCFRKLLTALSRPGRIVELPAPQGLPEPFMPATAALALTLLDLDTAVFLDPCCDNEHTRRYLRFHCNCPLSSEPDKAAFCLLCQGSELQSLSCYQTGSLAAPEQAATLVIQVDSLTASGGVRLTGPGIETESFLHVQGLDPSFWPAFQAQRNDYPLGVDVFLTAGTSAVGLPRSLRVEF